MKKLLLVFGMALFLSSVRAQCVPTCSNYVLSSITYSTLATPGASNIVSSFVPSADDGLTPQIPLGFNFNFYCNTYTSVVICSNGFVQFDNGIPAIASGYSDPAQAFPDPTNPNDMIALNMDDFDATSTGTVTYVTLGTAPNRMFVVTFSNVPIWTYPTSLNSGQIVLYETSNIIEIYTANVTNNSIYNGTQGIENANGTAGIAISGRSNAIWSASNSAYRFSLADGPAPLVASIGGVTSLCQGTTGNYSIATLPGATSYNWSFPGGWMGTSTTSAISATAGSSGAVQVSVTYTCGTSNTTTLAVTSLPAPVVAISSSSPIICSGEVIGLFPSGATNYTIEPGTMIATIGVTVEPIVSTTYTLYGTDVNNCVSQNNPVTMVTVNESPTVTVNSGSICLGQQFTITASGADSFNYSTGFPLIAPPIAGIYTYSTVGTNTNGCTAPPAITTLTVLANPSVTISASKTAICKNDPVTVTATGADTYVWVNGPSTDTYVSTPLLNTSYTVMGTTAEGCSKSAFINIVVSPCTGIAEQDKAAGLILVYPNPSNGEFTLNTVEETAVTIYNLQGQLIFKQNLPAGQQLIDLRTLSSGQYFLKATGSNASRSVILIKE